MVKSIVLRSYGLILFWPIFLEIIEKCASLNVPHYRGKKHWSLGALCFALKVKNAFTNMKTFEFCFNGLDPYRIKGEAKSTQAQVDEARANSAHRTHFQQYQQLLSCLLSM